MLFVLLTHTLIIKDDMPRPQELKESGRAPTPSFGSAIFAHAKTTTRFSDPQTRHSAGRGAVDQLTRNSAGRGAVDQLTRNSAGRSTVDHFGQDGSYTLFAVL